MEPHPGVEPGPSPYQGDVLAAKTNGACYFVLRLLLPVYKFLDVKFCHFRDFDLLLLEVMHYNSGKLNEDYFSCYLLNLHLYGLKLMELVHYSIL